MPRENYQAKARRLLVEARVVVLEAHGRHIEAVVRGDTSIWLVAHSAGSWSCDCPSMGRCSHVQAVQWVTAPVRPR